MAYCEECKARLAPNNPEVGGYLLRTGQYFAPICHCCPHENDKETTNLEDRISNLESIVALPGQLPRQYYDQYQQLRGELVYLQNALNSALDRGKKKAQERVQQQARKEQFTKPTYKGLNA